MNLAVYFLVVIPAESALMDLHSNGFKFKGSDSASAIVNASGNIYIY